MTPTWAVILVGVISGALASLVTAAVTASHERAAELRSRMLNAADEFSTAVIVALRQTRNAAGAIKDVSRPLVVDANGSFREEIKTLLDAANDAIDDVFAKEARIHLLFADQSPASIAAWGVTTHLQRMQMSLEHRPDSIRGHAAMLTFRESSDGTHEQHEKFHAAALVAIEQTWWDSFRERWRRRQSA
jgi:hypothetical protein